MILVSSGKTFDMRAVTSKVPIAGYTTSEDSPSGASVILEQLLNDSDSDPFYIDESEGQDPEWGSHIWNWPLWIVPFDVHF